MELLYVVDLVLIAETEELLLEKLRNRKKGMEMKDLRVNSGEIMRCRVNSVQSDDSGEHSCGVCRKGVGCNSIMCTECLGWVHKRCSGISGRVKSNVDFR